MGRPSEPQPRTGESEPSRQRSPSTTKRHLSWSEFEKLVLQLAMKIDHEKWRNGGPKWHPDIIWGIPRNGLVIATMLGHALGIAEVCSGSEYILTPSQKVLLVDDLSDTGQSFDRWVKGLNQDNQDYMTAALFWKPWSRYKPDIYVEETQDWIVFPWEEPNWALLEGK